MPMPASDPFDPSSADSRQRRVIGPWSATGISIAAMIGSGIFAVTGEIGGSLGTTTHVLLAWILGGVVALAGAITLAEVASMRPRASAQYVVVHEALGPTVGYLNGMITLVVGYLAANAAVALIAGAYVKTAIPELDERVTATILLVLLGAQHATFVRGGKRLNDSLVLLKLGVIVLLIVAGGWVLLVSGVPTWLPAESVVEAARLADPTSALATIPAGATAAEAIAHLRAAPGPSLASGALGAAVVTVTFAYLGWSNAADVAGELREPSRSVPIAVVGSVLIVGVLYVLVNLVYLAVVPPAAMATVATDGSLRPMTGIGAVVATHLFGPDAGRLLVVAIVFLLMSTLSVGIMTCGRVIAGMSWQGQLPASLGALNPHGAPTLAIALLTAASVAIAWISGLRSLLEYVGILVTVASSLAMLAAMVLRRRRPDAPRPFRMPLHPLPPLVALGLGGWIIVASAIADWRPLAASAGTIVVMLAARPLLRARAVGG